MTIRLRLLIALALALTSLQSADAARRKRPSARRAPVHRKVEPPFVAGDLGRYDAGACNDPDLTRAAARQGATPFLGAPGAGGETLEAALHSLARQYGDTSMDVPGVCVGAAGSVYLVPNRRVAELKALLGDLHAGGAPSASGAAQP